MQKGINPYNTITVIFWMILTIIAFGLAIAMLGLGFTSLAYVGKNITKIDLMKGTFRFNDKRGFLHNPYDLGWITNFATVFEGNLWDFWWPSSMIPRADGLRFQMVPPVRITDVDDYPLIK